MHRKQMLYASLDALRDMQDAGHTYLREDGTPHHLSFAQLMERASGIRALFAEAGLKKGDRVGLIVPGQQEFVATFIACVMAGLTAVPLNTPLLTTHFARYVANTRKILAVAAVSAVATMEATEKVVAALRDEGMNDLACIRVDAPPAGQAQPYERAALTPDDVCFIQYTSGSTGTPRGVIVTYGNLAANCHAIMRDGIGILPEDVGVSWLPMYHDMGLIGKVLAPLTYATRMVYIPTLAFIRRPHIWMDAVSRYGGTITFGPNFAFALAAKRFRRAAEGLDLSRLRVVGCGAEPINPEVLTAFHDCFAPYGLRANALMPSYGLAEATLAVTFANSGKPPHVLTIERQTYEQSRVARPATDAISNNTLSLVSCGRSFPEHEIGIFDEQGRELPEGAVGEIRIKGPSVTKGYFRDETASAALFADGWLKTGDLGFLLDGELYVSGRLKDIIIVNGRNYYPQDIEWAVESLAEVREGNVAAFGIADPSGEAAVVVAEARGASDGAELAERIARTVGESCGVALREVVLVAPGTLPKTSSGKIRRHQVKKEYLDGAYADPDRSSRAQTSADKDALNELG